MNTPTQSGHTDRQYTDLPGARTAYVERGSGRPLVMVHGVGLNASAWAPQIEEFSAQYRVIAYDTLGHGGSALPPAGATLEDYAAQLSSLLDYLGIDQAILLGHSLGALIATLFSLDRPERVLGLIAANPVYRRSDAQLAMSGARVRLLEEHGSGAALDEALLRWFGTPPSFDAAPVRRVRQWISRANPQGYARAYRVFTEADPWLDGRLDKLAVPALFVTGGLDPNSTPEMARTMAEEAPLGQSIVLPGERHMVAYISPDRFNTVIREFLDGMQASPAGKQTRPGQRVEQA